jgi:hypothetical protein
MTGPQWSESALTNEASATRLPHGEPFTVDQRKAQSVRSKAANHDSNRGAFWEFAAGYHARPAISADQCLSSAPAGHSAAGATRAPPATRRRSYPTEHFEHRRVKVNHPNVRALPFPVTDYCESTHRRTIDAARTNRLDRRMQHVFTHAGSNALLSAHVCEVCGLVVSLASSQSKTSLPLDGCCVRNDVQSPTNRRLNDDRK